MSLSPSINIIGAGIAGLTLARALRRLAIPSTIYERLSSKHTRNGRGKGPSTSPILPDPLQNVILDLSRDQRRSIEASLTGLSSRHNYGITLSYATTETLARLLDLTTAQLRHYTAVDGRGLVDPDTSLANGPYRANLARVEALLADGLDIRYDHDLTSIEPQTSNTPITLRFGNGSSLSPSPSNITIGADGVHSPLRTFLLPTETPHVLPYAVYHGTRTLNSSTQPPFQRHIFRDSNVITLRRDNFVLSVNIDERKEGADRISWTYSRAARGDNDPLHKPHRAKDEAKTIPDALYEEMSALAQSGLEEPFAAVVEMQALKGDRVLNWLMRSVVVDANELRRVADSVGVVFIGDAAHATPIVGSRGADEAVGDALALASVIEKQNAADVGSFYTGEDRIKIWTDRISEAEAQLKDMHEASSGDAKQESKASL
jgi:tyrosinase